MIQTEIITINDRPLTRTYIEKAAQSLPSMSACDPLVTISV